MAKDVMNKPVSDKKPSKIMEILRTEYSFEKVALGVLGIFVVILGVYLIEGTVLEIRLTNWWIFNTDTKILIFSIFVIVIGAVSFVMAIWPFFTPSFAEMKKVTWPNRSTILNHSARVFGFIFFIAAFFILTDWVIRLIVEFWGNTLAPLLGL
jgi:preprotein translocase subunit SecE